MHAFMHYHMAKHAQLRRKIIKICSIKIQFYIIFYFWLFFKQCITNFSKLSSFSFMRLSDSTFLNIENDPSTLQEVTGAYLCEEIWGKVSIYYILLQFPNVLLLLSFLSTFGLSVVTRESRVRNSCVTKKAVRSPYFPTSLSLSLSLSPSLPLSIFNRQFTVMWKHQILWNNILHTIPYIFHF